MNLKWRSRLRHEDILTRLAPCGLDCSRCFAFSGGEIRRLAAGLKHALGNFDKSARRFAAFMPVFEEYPSFEAVLAFLAQGDCEGCRRGGCRYPDCGVMPCATAKGIDFCFQCAEFPCARTNFDADLERRWIRMNERMKEIGVEAYFDETKDSPRYG